MNAARGRRRALKGRDASGHCRVSCLPGKREKEQIVSRDRRQRVDGVSLHTMTGVLPMFPVQKETTFALPLSR